MLEPLTALGVVANVFQLIDYLRKTLSDAHEIYKATDGASIRNSELESISIRLEELIDDLSNRMPKGNKVQAFV